MTEQIDNPAPPQPRTVVYAVIAAALIGLGAAGTWVANEERQKVRAAG